MNYPRTATAFWTVILTFTASFVIAADLPLRTGDRPETTTRIPHVQIGAKPVPELSNALLEHVAQLPGVQLGETRLSMPGAVGFQLQPDLKLAHPKAIVGGREFAHLHPNGSLHASLEPALAREAIAKGWAISHPWASRREEWAGFVMIYTPTDAAQLDVVVQLVKSSYAYVTGQTP